MIYSTSNVPLLAMRSDPFVFLPSCSAVAATFLSLSLSLMHTAKKANQKLLFIYTGKGGGSPGDPAQNIGIV